MDATTSRTPTEEQSAILDLANKPINLMINAYAGTGKTSTLKMFERATRTKPALYLVFNLRNAKEAEKEMLSTTSVKTLNSIGHRAWAASIGRNLKLDQKKTDNIFRDIVNEAPKKIQRELWSIKWEVTSAVAKAKALGYVPEGKLPTAKRMITQSAFHTALDEKPDDLVIDMTDAVLLRSIQSAYDGHIDFNDQLYMPAIFGGIWPKFPLVMVDEFQDMSPVNLAMIYQIAKGRFIGVGDRWQNIYGFRGALAKGMDEAVDHFHCENKTLSVSFRCPQAIVEASHWHVPDFKWMRSGGHAEVLTELDGSTITENSAIICRNNAPLFRMAFNLLAAGISVNVSGSDIGPRLIGQMRRLGDGEMRQAAVLSAIDEWFVLREEKGSKTASDMAECMRVFARKGSTLEVAIAYAEHLFQHEGSVLLMTGHKAKGLEFDTVYHLDPWLCGNDSQDQNLRYVITTRSRDTLYEIDTASITWPK